MDGIGALARRYGFDAVLVVGAVGTAVDVALRRSALRSSVLPGWFGVLAASVLVLALLGRHGWPFGAPALVWLLGAALAFTDGRLVITAPGVSAAGLVAAFLLGEVDDERLARAALVIVLAGAACVVYNDPHHAAGDFVFVPVPFAIAWLAGYALRERAARAATAEQRVRQVEHDREAAARVAVAEERARIARELHDVVAHAVSVMVLQVGAVRHNLDDASPADRAALTSVEETGRTALAEMRRLLGALRRTDEDVPLGPQPGLDALEPLVDAVRRAGLPVQVRLGGEPCALPPTLDRSAYRVVQEGLTNVLKHAGASRADVLIDYAPDRLCVEIRDDGRGGSAGDGLGHGLIGIRERVKIHGGEMAAASAPGGGFTLHASFPMDGDLR
jgi:signal transduction histidine kinase